MMALPSPASNQKWRACLDKNCQQRAKIRTLSIVVAHAPLFERIRANVKKLQPILHRVPAARRTEMSLLSVWMRAI
jgi:hypothetical protein